MVTASVLFTFLAGFFAVVSTRQWWTRGEEEIRNRLERLFQPQHAEPATDLLLPVYEWMRNERLKKILTLAGLRRRRDLQKLLTLKRICFLLPCILTAILVLLDLSMGRILLLSGLSFSIFVLIPRILILRSIFRRRHEIEKHLPDALDLFILCLEAGLSFDSALIRVAEEEQRVSAQLSRELTMTHHEMRAGKPKEEALKNLAWRCGVEDLNVLVGAILQTLRFGTGLVRTLRVQAAVIRKKRRERIRAQILKTPVKLIFPLLFFIFPTLLIVILAPSLVEIFRHLDVVAR